EMRAPVAPLMGIWSRPVVLRCLKYVFAGGRECPIDFRTLKGSSDKRIGIAGWQNTSWRQMLGFRRAMHRFDARDSLARITSPTIVLHGDRDSLFPVAVAQNLSRAIVGAELRIVRGAGHILPLSHPEAILSALSDLLGLRAPASSRPS
ncbi:MAG: alpha/beta fold hydrolase, partial [Gemmatimonadales bacterium]